MRVVIVGGGMAGLTLAGLLKTRGVETVVVERVREYGRAGFGIGLYPFSANTLRETGQYDRYAEMSLPVGDYVMRDAHGGELQRMSIAEVLARVGGFMGMLERADLIDLLAAGAEGTDLRMGTTVEAFGQQGETVEVTLSDGKRLEADLLIGADGTHSKVREQLLGATPIQDWGYTAFTWWAPPTSAVGADVIEHWGAGALFGLYPLPGVVNAIAALPTPPGLQDMDADAMRAHVRDAFRDYPAPVQEAIAAAESAEIFPWPMVDHRAPEWVRGRVALVGDAATGFLPTAGVGASNAMKAAAVLADELGRADAATVPQALSLWEQRVRSKVEDNQQASRRLAKLMFVRRHTVARARDVVLRHYPVEKVAEEILKSNTTPF